MKTSIRLNGIVYLVIAGCIAPSFAARKPQLPLIPDLQKLMIRSQAHHVRQSPVVTPRLAKRMAPGTGSISGTVTLPDTPVTYLNPMVSVIDTFGWEVANLECNDAGVYSVTGLYPGAYLVMAYTEYIARYRDSSAITYLGNTRSLNAARWIHLAGGQSLAGQDIALLPKTQSSQPKIVVSGTCYEGPGTSKPLSGISLTVTIIATDQSLSFRTPKYDNCRTAPDGAFACTLSAAPGSYYGLIKASYYDTSFVPQWWDGSAITAQPAAVSLGASITGKEIHCARGGSITGVVIDELSDTLLDEVEVFVLDKDGYEISSEYCGDYTGESTFSITGLPEGAWYLKASSSYPSGPYATTYYPRSAFLDAATAVNVTAGNSTPIRMVLKRQSTGNASVGPKGGISGRITRQDNGAPIPEYGVQFTSGALASYAIDNTTTDSLGTYADSLPADSSYYVYTGNEMLLLETTPDYYISSTWYPGVTDQASAVKVKITQGSTQTVDIAVQQGGSIGGWVRTTANSGFSRYSYILSQSPGEIVYGYAWTDDFSHVYTAYVGDMSGFRFCGVRPGSYTVRMIAFNYDSYLDNGKAADHAFATALGIVVTKENTALNQVLTIPDGSATVTGTVEISPVNFTSFTYNIYCYSSDSILAGFAGLLGFQNTGTAKDGFFGRDEFPSATPARADYSLGKLTPGRYALARLSIDTSTFEISRQWYGTTTWEKFSYRELTNYYRQLLKPDIPSAAWITLAAGETQSGVNFGNIGAMNPGKSNQAGNTELRILHGTSRNVALHYRLPEFDRSKPAVLAIYTPDGAQIETIRLAAPHGTVTWDGKNDRSVPVSSGVYVFRLTGAGHVMAVKGAWVR